MLFNSPTNPSSTCKAVTGGRIGSLSSPSTFHLDDITPDRSMSGNDNIASLASQLQSTEINNPKEHTNPKEARKAERAAQLAAEQAAKAQQESENDYSKHLYGHINDKRGSMHGKKVFTSPEQPRDTNG